MGTFIHLRHGLAARRQYTAILLSAMLAHFLLNACSSSRPPLRAPAPVSSKKSGVYRIAAGDYLTIRLYYHPELNTEAWVRPDGYISLELLGEIRAAGHTPAALDSLLQARYSRKLLQPEVVVMVKSSASQKVYVGGEVQSPQMVPLEGELNVMSAIIHAGGFKSSAKVSEILLLRNHAHSGPATLKINLKAALQGRSPEANILLQPYDVIYVPKTGIAKAGEFVDSHIEGLLPVSTISGFTWLYVLLRQGL